MAKMGETGVNRETVAKMAGTRCGKKKWVKLVLESPWQKWMELTVAKMGGNGVINDVTKLDGPHCGKNGWSSS